MEKSFEIERAVAEEAMLDGKRASGKIEDRIYTTTEIIEILENDSLYWAIHIGEYTTTTYGYVYGKNVYFNGLYPIDENNRIYECKSKNPLPINSNTSKWKWKLVPKLERRFYEFDDE